jgi:RND family efflux transporter MFP subunit
MNIKSQITILGLIILFASCKSEKQKEDSFSNQDIIPVKIISLRQDTVSQAIKTSGYFTTEDETPLSFKNGGIIDHIYVKEGDAIKKGQLLATVRGAEVDAGLNQAMIGYQKAQRDYQRASSLYHDSVATLEQMQNSKTALEVAKQQVNVASFNQQHNGIRAMENGFVLKKFLNEGQLAGPGTPVLMVNGAGNEKWLFKISVSEAEWAQLNIGDMAEITTDVAPNKTINASVVKKSEGVDPETGGLTVKLSLKSTKGLPLASGVFGNVTLHPSQKQVAWQVPYDAVLDGDAGYGYVFITNDKKIAHKIKVHISGLGNGYVLVNSGLEDAQNLIVSGSAYLKDGSSILIKE